MYQAGLKYKAVYFKSSGLLILFLSLFSCRYDLLAANYNVSFSHTIENSSNVQLIPNDFIDLNLDVDYDDTINSSLIYVNFNEDSSGVKATVNYSINYLDYENNIASDVTRNNLKSEVLWRITPGYYSWLFVDNFTQTRTDPSLVFSEANTQDVNEFITGPKFEWRVGDSTINLESSIHDYDYSETDNDSSDITTNLRWGKKMPSGMNLYLKYSTKYVTYENDALEGYSHSSVGVNFSYQRVTNNLDIFYGRTFLNSDDVDKNEFSNFSITYRRQISRSSFIRLVHTSGLNDQNDSIGSAGTVLNGVFVNTTSSINYNRTSSSLDFDIKFFQQNRKDSDTGSSDAKSGGEISLSRILDPRSQIRLSYKESHDRVNNVLVLYDDNVVESRLEYSKLFNNKLSLRVYASDIYVESSKSFRGYSDKRVGVTFSISR